MMTVIGTVLIVLATIGIGLLVDRKWSLLPRPKPHAQLAPPPPTTHAPGEAPSTALAVSDAESIRHMCPDCHGPTEPLPDERVHYDGHELLVVHSRCPACGRTRAIYVRPA